MPHILRVPAGSDRSRSLLTPIVALVAVVVLGGCGTAATTTTIRAPRDPTADLGKPTAPPVSVLSSIVCTSQDDCLAVGNSFEAVAKVPHAAGQTMSAIAATTSDGGVHWASFSLSTRIETAPALSCPSTKSCVAVGGTARTGPVEGGEALRTADGGETWVRSIIPPGVGALRGVSCPTKAFCVAVGEAPDGNRGVALMTRDSGRIWTHLSLPRGEDRLSLVSCPSINSCVVAVDNLRATVITTNDGGKSWTQTSLPQPSTGSIGTNIAEGISCPSPSRCFIVGGFTLGAGTPSGLIFTSSNGGNRWTSQSLPSGTLGLFGISCRTLTTCVVVGGYGGVVGGIILTTTDAGATWMPRSGPAAVSDLQNVSCPTLKRCVATGISPSASTTAIAPVVATSSDGGVTWMSFTP